MRQRKFKLSKDRCHLIPFISEILEKCNCICCKIHNKHNYITGIDVYIYSKPLLQVKSFVSPRLVAIPRLKSPVTPNICS